ncbi:MocR-like pyridoxine biosynthesis transcription factor PdxR [Undibacterium terreum]|uniref:GntR family transcriptional regulator n=1 Tax=Undibacterium terreum TaxID=1224302 RepID=A0A916UVQ4_9BURK|nr:PLP-dependent aminotransferase family protein [Undibacterium terreum]GGC89028.1 GntR family transcriptional regulator [Undibacterium terreum]
MSSPQTHSFISLNASDKEPLYRQIYHRFQSAITDRLLKPGDRIPAARALAAELGLARGTVEAAYTLLIAEGYVETRGQAGTVVTPGLQPRAPIPQVLPPASQDNAIQGFYQPTLLPFQMGLPALDAFPRKIWARLTARSVRAMQATDMIYPQAAGSDPLRIAIAQYVQFSRGINCSPAQVFVTSGYRSTLELIVRALLKPGDSAWVEQPGYPPTNELLSRAGMTLAPVPVDQEGILVAHGIKVAPRAKLAVVTPAHQSSLCMSLSLQRRFALLDWAVRAKAWIVEDDYDGEYRYVSRPLPALKSLDRDGRVLYAGTFSKVLFPAIRLAYLIVPEEQVEHFNKVNLAFSSASPALTQAVVNDFITEGHFARHIQRMRRLYGERRQMAADGLSHVLGKHLSIDPQPGGMHLILRMRGKRTDRALAQRIREHGMSALALSDRSAGEDMRSALLLGFTNIDSRQTAEALGRRILSLL